VKIDEENIKNCLDLLLQSWSNDYRLLEKCTVKKPYLYFSNFGKCYVVSKAMDWFSLEQQKSLEILLKIGNYTVHIANEKAVQYATVIGCYIDASKDKHLAFSGTFANQLVKEKEVWKFEVIRFELQTDDIYKTSKLDEKAVLVRKQGEGDRSLTNNWNMVDDRIGRYMDPLPYPVGKRNIVAEYDSP